MIRKEDIETIIKLIDAVSERGAIKGHEMFAVGMLRQKLEHTLVNHNDEEDDEKEFLSEDPKETESEGK